MALDLGLEVRLESAARVQVLLLEAPPCTHAAWLIEHRFPPPCHRQVAGIHSCVLGMLKAGQGMIAMARGALWALVTVGKGTCFGIFVQDMPCRTFHILPQGKTNGSHV